MRKVLYLIVVLLILVVILHVGKNTVAKFAVTKSVKALTGLKMNIASMDVSIVNTSISMNGMKLFNAPEYSDRIMVYMPEIHVDYNLGSILKGKTHLKEVKIQVKELNVIKSKDKKLNIDALNIVKESKRPEKSYKEKKTEVMIEKLSLKIGEVMYKDFSLGSKPEVITYDVNLNETFHKITDLNQIGKLILVRALMNTNIANLANFALAPLKSDISETLKQAVKPGTITKELKEESGRAMKKAVEGITKELKLPFGE
jgi:hypothetical protein